MSTRRPAYRTTTPVVRIDWTSALKVVAVAVVVNLALTALVIAALTFLGIAIGASQ